MFVVKFNLRSKESKDNDSPFIFGSFHFETLNFPIRESHPTHFITFPYPMIHQPVMIRYSFFAGISNGKARFLLEIEC